jgi:hypothetical protein
MKRKRGIFKERLLGRAIDTFTNFPSLNNLSRKVFVEKKHVIFLCSSSSSSSNNNSSSSLIFFKFFERDFVFQAHNSARQNAPSTVKPGETTQRHIVTTLQGALLGV